MRRSVENGDHCIARVINSDLVQSGLREVNGSAGRAHFKDLIRIECADVENTRALAQSELRMSRRNRYNIKRSPRIETGILATAKRDAGPRAIFNVDPIT